MGMIVLEDIDGPHRATGGGTVCPAGAVSVEIEHSFDRISETDDLADGIDYREVIEFIREFCGTMMGKPSSVWPTFFANRSKKNFLPGGYIWF